MRRRKFVRHGKAKKAETGQKDQDRQLNDVGIEQAMNRRSVSNFSKVNLVISSSAPRAFMTAHLVTGFSVDDIVKLDELYPEPVDEITIEFDRLFNLLDYKSVATYLNEAGGECVMVWAENVWPVIANEISSGDDDVAIFGHAVCLPALAMVMCKDNPDLVARLAQINLNEAEGFEVIFDDSDKPIDVVPIVG